MRFALALGAAGAFCKDDAAAGDRRSLRRLAAFTFVANVKAWLVVPAFGWSVRIWDISYVYLANIIGSAAGSLVTGFVFLDVLPLQQVGAAAALRPHLGASARSPAPTSRRAASCSSTPPARTTC